MSDVKPNFTNREQDSRFIVFEGPNGIGKSTLIKGVSEYLKQTGKPHIVVKEPSSLMLGKTVRRWIRSHRFMFDSYSALVALNLFTAARLELIQEKILPALSENKIVLCDRFVLSTSVYQNMCYSSELTEEKFIKLMLTYIQRMVEVTDTVFIDIPPFEICKRLKQKNKKDKDPLDAESIVFHQDIVERYNYRLKGIAFPKSLIGKLHRINGMQPFTSTLKDTINSLFGHV